MNFPNLHQLLFWANQYPYFCFLNSNDFKGYLHDGFKNYLAVSNNAPITKLPELKSKIGKKWLFGHFGYDLKNQIEHLSSQNPDQIQFDDLTFFEPEIVLEVSSDGSLKTIINTSKKVQIIEEIANINTFSTYTNHLNPIQSKLSKKEYFQKFEQIRKHIEQGDVYELNFCQEFFAHNSTINPIEIYLSLCQLSPMPFSTLYKNKHKYLICASPERFLKKVKDKLISQPIKGTNKSYPTIEENKIQQEQLKNSEKERAENMMIVDLVRNDLAKSAQTGSVSVEELFGIYKMNQVNQMISTISAKKRNDISIIDVILNAFPMGSMTGAPKIEAMKLIEHYEISKRGLYAGTVGYITPNQDFDFNVVIRSILYNQKNKYISFQVGGAITYDANAEDEYNECLLKAESIIKILNNVIQN